MSCRAETDRVYPILSSLNPHLPTCTSTTRYLSPLFLITPDSHLTNRPPTLISSNREFRATVQSCKVVSRIEVHEGMAAKRKQSGASPASEGTQLLPEDEGATSSSPQAVTDKTAENYPRKRIAIAVSLQKISRYLQCRNPDRLEL